MVDLFSIIIVNYNGERFLKPCLDSILKSNYQNFEVIVVDNASKDKSLEILASYNNSKIKVIPLKHNLHFAGGNNEGFKHSLGNYIIFLNNDTIVHPNWLTELQACFNQYRNISAAQCVLLDFNGKISNIGGTIDYGGKLVSSEYLWGINDEAAKQNQIFFGCGAALCVERSRLLKSGLFDPATPTDEIDLCWRINLSGGKIVLSSKSFVYHYGGCSYGKGIKKQRIYYAELAAVSNILKNFAAKRAIIALNYYAFNLLISIAIDIVLRRRIELTIYRFKAYRDILINLRSIMEKRAHTQTNIRTMPDSEICKLILPPNPKYFKIA